MRNISKCCRDSRYSARIDSTPPLTNRLPGRPWSEKRASGPVVAGQLAANSIFFVVSLYFPRRKLTAKLPATWPPTFAPTVIGRVVLPEGGRRVSHNLWRNLGFPRRNLDFWR